MIISPSNNPGKACACPLCKQNEPLLIYSLCTPLSLRLHLPLPSMVFVFVYVSIPWQDLRHFLHLRVHRWFATLSCTSRNNLSGWCPFLETQLTSILARL